ncbi:AsnC family transcriptional regulator [Sesbania bispinosa]|nr:AsnC family transcriptional regulator [Sesbania bispinosa]
MERERVPSRRGKVTHLGVTANGVVTTAAEKNRSVAPADFCEVRSDYDGLLLVGDVSTDYGGQRRRRRSDLRLDQQRQES